MSSYQQGGDLETPGATPSAEKRTKGPWIWIGALIAIVLGCLAFFNRQPIVQAFEGRAPGPSLADGQSEDVKNGEFKMSNFDSRKPFSSFLPGIAGVYGTPMWLFYINRGQGVAAFGTENKEHPLYQFESANIAYQVTPYTGFRTFLKGTRGKQNFSHQPFFPDTASSSGVSRDMTVAMNKMTIEESNADLGIDTKIQYFSVSNEEYPGLVRQVTLTNTDPTESATMDVVDGLTQMMPYGVFDWYIKNMGRTTEAWMKVYNLDQNPGLPYYKMSASIKDSEVHALVLSLTNPPDRFVSLLLGNKDLLPYIVDPTVVFGQDTAMQSPQLFLKESLKDLLNKPQSMSGKTPCAYSAASVSLAAGESVTITSIYGFSPDIENLNNEVLPSITANGFANSKLGEADSLTRELTDPVMTLSKSGVFDGYVRQNFLDNWLRGGYPKILGDGSVYHTYSRIHGDLERDYNYYVVAPTFYSQGPGNYRDVNQNRRSDIMFEPRVGDFNIRTFLSLMQADGYNPLTVNTALFSVPDKKEVMGQLVSTSVGSLTSNHATALKELLAKPFWPGDLFKAMKDKNVKLQVPKDEFLNLVTEHAEQVFYANYTQDGFWADHWTYDLDLVDSYLTVFPDKKEELLFDSQEMPFFMSEGQVQSRSNKTVMLEPGKIRQVGAVAVDPEKHDLLQERITSQFGYWQRDNSGEIFTLPLMGKLLMLGTLKFATLDPQGMGVEMEGGKPGWMDAMNGLPALFGSGMPESFEALRVLKFCRGALSLGRMTHLPKEYGIMLSGIKDALDVHAQDQDDFAYWDTVAGLREVYRESVRLTFNGEKVQLSPEELGPLLDTMIAKMEVGQQKALDFGDGVVPCYFSWTVTDYIPSPDAKEGDQYVKVMPKGFKPTVIPLFLEGPVRQMKVLTKKEDHKAVYEAVKHSTLRDKELKMYKICESLEGQSEEVGRAVGFTPGWLENESIWLHMSYKFYLELLRAGLYDEFWAELQDGCVAFMDPSVYGRSPLEASSFITSSAHPDKSLHGVGFVSRLSGSTAEFLSMWELFMAGPTPFIVNNGSLEVTLSPALPSWLFTDAGTVTFTLVGTTKVTYHNPQGKDTWASGMKIEKMRVVKDGNEV
ncbi:unnamed protein product, partial [Chrysoparadoxa australica]